MEFDTNRYQKGAKFDAKTHQKSMPKLVRGNIMNQKNVFLCMEESFKLIVKKKGFQGLAGCVRERKRYPKNIKTNINIHPKSMQNRYKIRERRSDPKKSNTKTN